MTRRCSVASGVSPDVSLECPAAFGLASERTDRWARPSRGMARIRDARRGELNHETREHVMFIIGIDPHKGSHTAVVVDCREAVVATIRVDADRHQRSRLLEWARRFEPRTWAVEGATGMGAMLAQQLVGAGEHVVDVPAKLSARVRLLERGSIDKTDPNDARSAAIVAWRTPALNVVTACDEHKVVLGLLADRDHQITAQRTRTICRLHALLCLLIEGGTGRSLTVARAEKLLASVCIDGTITIERIATAGQLLDEVRALDAARVEVRRRHVTALEASQTTVTEVCGIGPLMAAIILGRAGDVRRFPTAGHFARCNGTAPIEASSGPTKRHRFNPRGDRQLNHAMHMAAVTQVRRDTPGLLPPQANRRKVAQRSPACPQAPHQ
jgi:transposase